MTTKKVKGRVAKLKDTIYKHALDIRAFTACSTPPRLEHLLPADDNAQAIDLSGIMFRMQRAIGGSWTEYMHADEGLHQLATYWVLGLSLNTHCLCTFCKNGIWTPRHNVRACPETKQYTEAICDALEAEMSRLCNQQQMIEAGKQNHVAKSPTAIAEDTANT